MNKRNNISKKIHFVNIILNKIGRKFNLKEKSLKIFKEDFECENKKKEQEEENTNCE
jgi:hypothetical protein